MRQLRQRTLQTLRVYRPVEVDGCLSDRDSVFYPAGAVQAAVQAVAGSVDAAAFGDCGRDVQRLYLQQEPGGKAALRLRDLVVLPGSLFGYKVVRLEQYYAHSAALIEETRILPGADEEESGYAELTCFPVRES